LKLYGGFAGDETSLDQRDPATHLTVLSGDLNGDDGPDFAGNGENSHHVLFLDGTTTPVTPVTVLDGFTVSGGNGNVITWPHYAGGGLFCDGSGAGMCSPTLRNLVFSGNTTAAYGGAVYADGIQGTSSPAFVNVAFSGNTAQF